MGVLDLVSQVFLVNSGRQSEDNFISLTTKVFVRKITRFLMDLPVFQLTVSILAVIEFKILQILTID